MKVITIVPLMMLKFCFKGVVLYLHFSLAFTYNVG